MPTASRHSSKAADALVPGGGMIPYLPENANYQFEAELVIAIAEEGAKVGKAEA